MGLGSRILGSKRHRIPDPGSGSATLMQISYEFFLKRVFMLNAHDRSQKLAQCRVIVQVFRIAPKRKLKFKDDIETSLSSCLLNFFRELLMVMPANIKNYAAEIF
jgi:hypothetical protein